MTIRAENDNAIDTAGAGSKAPSAGSLGLARTRLELKAFFREKDALIFSFLFPIIMLGIFSVAFGGEDWAIGDAGGPEIDSPSTSSQG